MNDMYCNYTDGDVAATLDASYYKGPCARNGKEREFIAQRTTRQYVVRRLTPLECCRLQGFPDWWTDGVPGSDSAQYKMWGNGMALPCMLYVLQGIDEEEKTDEGEGTDASGAWGFVQEDTLRKAMMALMHEVERKRKEIEP